MIFGNTNQKDWTTSQRDIDSQFEEITKNVSISSPDNREKPAEDRIVVLINFPHLEKYGHESTRELVYGCSFSVKVGDLVSCPPTRLHPKRTNGVVISLGNNGYKGPVKYVRKAKNS